MVEAIEAGFPQREIMDAAYAYQRSVEAEEKLIVGVNAFQLEQEEPIELLYIADDAGRARRSRSGRGQAPAAIRGRWRARSTP